ncbi:MAG: hypothetical protein ABII18_04405 [bacterium]
MLLCPTPQLRTMQITSAANHLGFFSYQLGQAVTEDHSAKATFRLGEHQFTHVRRTDNPEGSSELKIQKVFWEKGQPPRMLNEASAKITTQGKETGMTLTKAANYKHCGLVKAELDYGVDGAFRGATLSRSHEGKTRTLVIQLSPDVSIAVLCGARTLHHPHQDSWQVEYASNILSLTSGTCYGMLGLSTVFDWLKTPDRISLYAKKRIEPANTFRMIDLILFVQRFFIQGQTVKNARVSKKPMYETPQSMSLLKFLNTNFKSTV